MGIWNDFSYTFYCKAPPSCSFAIFMQLNFEVYYNVLSVEKDICAAMLFQQFSRITTGVFSSSYKEMLNSFFAVVSIFFLSSERRHLTSAKWNEGRMGERWELWLEKNCWKHCQPYRHRWSSKTFPEIVFKLLSLKRWMHCWSLTVQPKTSTTESSTVVSCCSLEIWSGPIWRLFLLKIIFFLLQVVCLLQWRRD